MMAGGEQSPVASCEDLKMHFEPAPVTDKSLASNRNGPSSAKEKFLQAVSSGKQSVLMVISTENQMAINEMYAIQRETHYKLNTE